MLEGAGSVARRLFEGTGGEFDALLGPGEGEGEEDAAVIQRDGGVVVLQEDGVLGGAPRLMLAAEQTGADPRHAAMPCVLTAVGAPGAAGSGVVPSAITTGGGDARLRKRGPGLGATGSSGDGEALPGDFDSFRRQSLLVGDVDSNATSRLRVRAWVEAAGGSASERDQRARAGSPEARSAGHPGQESYSGALFLRVTPPAGTRAELPPVGSDPDAQWPTLQYVSEDQGLGAVPRWRQPGVHRDQAELVSAAHVVVFRGSSGQEAARGGPVSSLDIECAPHACNEVLRAVTVRAGRGSCGSHALQWEVQDESGGSGSVHGDVREPTAVEAGSIAGTSVRVEVEAGALAEPAWQVPESTPAEREAIVRGALGTAAAVGLQEAELEEALGRAGVALSVPVDAWAMLRGVFPAEDEAGLAEGCSRGRAALGVQRYVLEMRASRGKLALAAGAGTVGGLQVDAGAVPGGSQVTVLRGSIEALRRACSPLRYVCKGEDGCGPPPVLDEVRMELWGEIPGGSGGNSSAVLSVAVAVTGNDQTTAARSDDDDLFSIF